MITASVLGAVSGTALFLFWTGICWSGSAKCGPVGAESLKQTVDLAR